MLKILKKGKENEYTKSAKRQDGWRKRKLQVLGNIACNHHQTNWNKIKLRIGYLRRTKDFTEPNSAAEISSKE